MALDRHKGVPLEMVATILGNTARVVELHYASFVQSRQVSLEATVPLGKVFSVRRISEEDVGVGAHPLPLRRSPARI